ncbi:MAG: tetratricopeptide repeat protein, partial [Candidatus Omnitrophota bacterium]
AAVSFYYLYLFFLPFGLSIDHSFPIISSLNNPIGIISLILIFALAFVSLFLSRRIARIIRFSCLWYFICLSPKFYARLNLVCAEHQAYLAFFALYFIFGFLLSKWKLKQIYLRGVFIFILGLFFLFTCIRNLEWRNDYILWKSTLKVNPNSGIAKGVIGMRLVDRGNIEEGSKYLEQSAYSAPMEITRITSTFNLVYNYALQGEPEKGLEILRQNRDYLYQADPKGFLKSLEFVYFRMGKHKESKEILEDLVRFYPSDAALKGILGWRYLQEFADKQRARQYFQAATKDDPDLAFVHLGMGVALEDEDLEAAIKEYNLVIKLAPNNPNAYYKLGLIYAKRLLSTRAQWYFKKTIELSPEFAPAYYNLCIFYLSLPEPDYELAQGYFEKAKELGYEVDQEIAEMLKNPG